MANQKPLTDRKKKVIDDLFDYEQDENKDGKQDWKELLRKHKVSRVIFNRWLNDPLFMAEITNRIRWCRTECELILSRNKPNAAKKLVGLATEAKTETARKACIDIINMTGIVDKSGVSAVKEQPGEDLTPELAGQVLAAMATAKQGGDAR